MKNKNLLLGVFNAIFANHKPIGNVVVALDLTTATGEMINFPDLKEGDTPKKDDKATINGKEADGEIKVTDGDKTYLYVFAAGVLTADPTEVVAEPADDTQAQLATATAANVELTTKYNELLQSVTALKRQIVSGDFDIEIPNPNTEDPKPAASTVVAMANLKKLKETKNQPQK